MNKSHLLGAVCAVLFSLITVSTNAALVGRLPITPGGTDYQAAYDDVLNITWVTDAGLSGAKTWDNQVAWASNLDYLGFDDWRLASMSVSAGVPTGRLDVNTITLPCGGDSGGVNELDCRDNELGYMYYHNMDRTLYAGTLPPGPHDQTVDGVLLTNIQDFDGPYYWSGTEAENIGITAFNFEFGIIFDLSKVDFNYGWAVRSGDVVPIPAAVWLFGSGLLGLIGIARHKKAA